MITYLANFGHLLGLRPSEIQIPSYIFPLSNSDHLQLRSTPLFVEKPVISFSLMIFKE